MLAYLTSIVRAYWKRKFNLSQRPLFVNFLLTYWCNAHCRMCNIWKTYLENPEKSEEELTLSQIESFLQANADYLSSLVQLGFTGGEPLLMRDDFVDIVRLFRRYLPRVGLGVQTNGLNPDLAEKKLKEITAFYPGFSLAVSIDGTRETHDKVRGVVGAFDKAIQTIRHAQELNIKRITCGMTLTPLNYQEIAEVKELVEKLGCEFSCFMAEEADYFCNTGANSPHAFSVDQEKEIAGLLQRAVPSHYYMDNLRRILQGSRKIKMTCFSGFTSLVIDPYGNVKPCILKVRGVENDVFGNIKAEKLETMLSSDRACRIREKIKKCSCWCQCEVSSSVVIWPLDVLRWFLFYCADRRGFLSHSLHPVMKRLFKR